MFRTTLVILPLLATLGATVAQEAASRVDSGVASTSSAPRSSDSVSVPQPSSATSVFGPSFTSTLGLNDTTGTNIQSDGAVSTYTGLTPEEACEWNKHVDKILEFASHKRRWTTALWVLGGVMLVTVICTVVSNRKHRSLRKKWAAERLGLHQPMSSVDHHLQPQENDTLPAYSAERPPSYKASPAASASSLALLSGAAAALPRATASTEENMYTFPLIKVYTEMPNLPGVPSQVFPKARAYELAAIRAIQVGAFVGLLLPCVIMWAYVAYVAVLIHREDRKDREAGQARSHLPVYTDEQAVSRL